MDEYLLYKSVSNHIGFEIDPLEYIPGSTFIFCAKPASRLPDVAALLVKTSDNGIIYDTVTGKGMIAIGDNDTDAIAERYLECDLQMITSSDAAYLLAKFRIKLEMPINRNIRA